MWNPMEMDFDDTVCVVCGKKLVEDPVVGMPDFDGYCCDECEEKGESNDTMLPLYGPTTCPDCTVSGPSAKVPGPGVCSDCGCSLSDPEVTPSEEEMYEVEPLTHTVFVRWEEDEEETPVLVTAREYEVLRELVNEEVL